MMMKFSLSAFVFAIVFCINSASASTKVLGFEMNVSTADQVKTTLSSKTKVVDQGINKFSQGKSLSTDGSSYEIEGLINVSYIFDPKNKLAAVVMLMDKSRFDSVFEAVSSKYKVMTHKKPFVGDKFARLNSGDSIIEINAPHMSFEMEVIYMRNDFAENYKNQIDNEAQRKKKNEASKF